MNNLPPGLLKAEQLVKDEAGPTAELKTIKPVAVLQDETKWWSAIKYPIFYYVDYTVPGSSEVKTCRKHLPLDCRELDEIEAWARQRAANRAAEREDDRSSK